MQLRRVEAFSGKTFFGGCRFDFAIDFRTQQDHQPSDVEPRKQNDDGPERTMGYRVVVEEMKVNTQPERGKEPSPDADNSRTRRSTQSALKQTKVHQYAVRYLLGGVCTMIAAW